MSAGEIMTAPSNPFLVNKTGDSYIAQVEELRVRLADAEQRIVAESAWSECLQEILAKQQRRYEAAVAELQSKDLLVRALQDEIRRLSDALEKPKRR